MRSDRRGKEITSPGSSVNPNGRAPPALCGGSFAQLNFPHPEIRLFVLHANEWAREHVSMCSLFFRTFVGMFWGALRVSWCSLTPFLTSAAPRCGSEQEIGPRKVLPYLHAAPIPATSCSNLPIWVAIVVWGIATLTPYCPDLHSANWML